MTLSWKRATTALKQHIPQLEEEDNPNDILFICYCDLVMSIKEIAELSGTSPFSVRRKLLKLGIHPKKRGGARRRKVTFLKKDLEEMSLKELSAKYKVSQTTVSRYKKLIQVEKGGVR